MRLPANPHELAEAILDAGFEEAAFDNWLPGFLCAVAVKKGQAASGTGVAEGTI